MNIFIHENFPIYGICIANNKRIMAKWNCDNVRSVILGLLGIMIINSLYKVSGGIMVQVT